MNFMKVKDAMRKILVSSTGIDPETQLKTAGNVFDPKGKKIWVQEFSPGGDISAMTNMRHSSNAFLLQYNFYVHSGTPAVEAEEKAVLFMDEIPPGTVIPCEGVDCMVRKAKYSISEGKEYTSVMLIVTLYVSAVDKNFINENK